MRFDLITIFPEFFAAAEVSLIGKAQAAGRLEIAVHNLRDWTDDPHRTVDDAPYGGGAGMVMKADVWGRALGDVLARDLPGQPGKRVLAIPTPSGQPLRQETVARLAREAGQIAVACGRYEGIDARVAEHYRRAEGVEVLEYSLGDYVLNGGEVAALALLEAVGRLVPEVVGNPESLVEESHGPTGLLEYPVYTRPPVWEGLEVPEVLSSGDHARVREWRRRRALERTLERRPDLAAALNPADFSGAEKEWLAGRGVLLAPFFQHVTIRPARPEEAAEVAELGAETFPDACPETLSPDRIAAFVAYEFATDTVAARLADPGFQYLVAEGENGALLGYTLSILDLTDSDREEMRFSAGAVYLSKCYVRGPWRGAGLAGALLEAAVAGVGEARPEATCIMLGTNIANVRAQKFYKRHGFKKAGRRNFDVGGSLETDVVMRRNL